MAETPPVPNCAKCPKTVCPTPDFAKGPENCPTQIKADIICQAFQRYCDPELAEFARTASIVEGSAYTRVPWSSSPTPLTTRLEEIIRFAKLMGYRKLGVAFCVGTMDEAGVLIPILENAGFQVVSVCCKTGGIPKEEIGIQESQKIVPGRWETMCNPISQAEILNSENTEFNIMMGLCVGHDALFLKHVKALTTVFVVKDRLLGHNPVAALYLSKSYYRRLRSKEIGAVAELPTISPPPPGAR